MTESDLKIIEGDEGSQISRHSNLNFLSFSMYQITWTFITAALTLYLYFYYHAVLGLEPWMIFLAIALITVWDSLNEPLVGYLVDRNFKWTKKWGRRFPWMVIIFIPWCLSAYLLFSAPDIDVTTNPWPIFWWLVMSYAIFDICITIMDINAGALRADKFRTEYERRKYASYFGPLDMIAQVIGMVVPGLFLGLSSGKAAYAIMGAMVAVVGIVFTILFLPGAREDKVIIDRYFSKDYERIPFFKGIKEVIKQKSFLAFYISYMTFTVATTLMTTMLIYLITFILQVGPEMESVLMAIFLICAIASVPFWLKLVKKFNDTRKVYTIGGFALCAALIPVTFFQTIVDLIIIFVILGFAIGCIWTLGVPVILSNVMDDYVVRTGKNQKGLVLGAWALVSRFSNFIDELLIMIVFGLTGFVAGVDTYVELVAAVDNVELALWGIRILIGLIPMLIILCGALFFWKFYPLTQEKVLENKNKLKELGF